MELRHFKKFPKQTKTHMGSICWWLKQKTEKFMCLYPPSLGFQSHHCVYSVFCTYVCVYVYIECMYTCTYVYMYVCILLSCSSIFACALKILTGRPTLADFFIQVSSSDSSQEIFPNLSLWKKTTAEYFFLVRITYG